MGDVADAAKALGCCFQDLGLSPAAGVKPVPSCVPIGLSAVTRPLQEQPKECFTLPKENHF